MAIFDVSSVSRLIDTTIININKNRETPFIVDNRLAIQRANPLFPKADAIAIPPPNNNNIPHGNLIVSSQFSKGLFFLSGIIKSTIAKEIAIIVSSRNGIIFTSCFLNIQPNAVKPKMTETFNSSLENLPNFLS